MKLYKHDPQLQKPVPQLYKKINIQLNEHQPNSSASKHINLSNKI